MIPVRTTPRQPVATESTDDSIQHRVKRELSAAGYPHLRSITVESQEGVVTLAGKVSRYHDMQIALTVAMRTEGVERLQNQITVMN